MAFPLPSSTGEDPTALPAGWQSQSIPFCVQRLTALFALQRELLRTEAAWLAGVPYWDAKLALAGHIFAGARHGEALLTRLHELKATSAEHRQIAGLEEFVRDLASARNGDEWLHGLYGHIKPWFIGLLEGYCKESDPIMDAPSHEVIRGIVDDLRGEVAWFRGFTPSFSSWEQSDVREWREHVAACLAVTEITDHELRPRSTKPTRPGARPDFGGITRVRRDASFRVMTNPTSRVRATPFLSRVKPAIWSRTSGTKPAPCFH